VIEVATRLILKGAAPVLALVADRIYFGVAEQNERRPRIVLTLVSSNRAHTHQGAGGYTRGRMQVDSLAPTYPDAKALAKAAQDALDNYVGTVDGTPIDWIETEEARDIPMATPAGGAAPTTFGVSFDARFMHQGV
jgi:hypothetical protein